jgi:hypothetical protein
VVTDAEGKVGRPEHDQVGKVGEPPRGP